MRNVTFHYRVLVSLVPLAILLCHAGEPDPIRSSSQLLVVTTANWDAVDGALYRFERSSSGKWQPVGNAVHVVVGKSGLAWGAGLIPADDLKYPGASDPIKKEGDKKAPAGVFRLSSTFGYADEKTPGWKMPYISLAQSVVCVDDPESKFYNQIVNKSQVSQDWNSAEQMRRDDELYRWGIVVDHNVSPAKPGGGSCIFLHIWRGPGEGTVGCTAMTRENLEPVLAWLDPAKKPMLVQLPESEYSLLRPKLKLPYVWLSSALVPVTH